MSHIGGGLCNHGRPLGGCDLCLRESPLPLPDWHPCDCCGEEKLARYVSLLRRLEWGTPTQNALGVYVCPCCRRWPAAGHGPGCEMGEALR